MRIELIHEERYSKFTRDRNVPLELVPLEALPRGIGGIGQKHGAEATPRGLEAKLVAAHEGLVQIAMEEWTRSDAREQTQSLLICRVIGGKVSDLDGSQCGHDASQAGSSAGDHAHVLASVLRLLPPTMDNKQNTESGI